MKYLTLTFRYSIGFVSRLLLLCWGYPLLNIRHPRRSESYTASLGFYTLYPFVGNPRRSPVSQGKNYFRTTNLDCILWWDVPYQPAVCSFPLSLAVVRGQAYYCYFRLLFAVERAGRNHLHFTRFTENIGKFSIIP